MIGEVDLSLDKNKVKLSIYKPDLARTKIANVKEFYNGEVTLRLSNINELSFQVPLKVDIYHKLKRNPIVDKLKERRIIKFQYNSTKEFYIITKITSAMDDNSDYIRVDCMSLGYELSWKLITGYSEISKTATEVLTDFLSETSWTIGTVHSSFDEIRRSPDISSATVLDAILQAAEAFNAVIDFDSVNKQINFLRLEDINVYKGLSASYGKLMKSVSAESDTSAFCTRLIPAGRDGIGINSVNPTGAGYIENYGFYMYPFARDEQGNILSHSEYMSDDLCMAILDYQELVEANKDTFDTLLSQLDTLNTTKTTQENSLFALENQLKIILDQLSVANASGQSNSSLITQKRNKETEITNQNALIATTEASIQTVKDQIEDLKTLLSVENNFTPELLEEWNYYIHVKEYTNDLIDDEQELYDAAVKEFDKLREPKIIVNLNIIDFMACIEQQHLWDKLNLGEQIKITHNELGIKVAAMITEIRQNFESNSIDLTISNVKEFISDKERVLKKLYDAVSTSTVVGSEKHGWREARINANVANAVINNPWDARTRIIKGGYQEQIEISHRGIIVAANDDPNKILVMQHGLLGLSIDNGENWKIACTPEGFNADVINTGELNVADSMRILNGNSTFIVDSDSVLIRDLDLIVTRSDGKSRFIVDTNSSVKIQTNQSGSWVDKLYADSNGNLTMTGKLVAGDIVGGTIIGASITSNSTISVNTDLSVGDNIRLGTMYASTEKYIYLKELAKIYTNGDSLNITAFANINLLPGGSAKVNGSTIATSSDISSLQSQISSLQSSLSSLSSRVSALESA